jgi:hypothetical protein
MAAASSSSSSSSAGPPASLGLTANAEFLFNAVFKSQSNVEAARRFYPVLRSWVETKKAYRGRVFSFSEVEEVIDAYERKVIALDPSQASPTKAQGDASAADASGVQKKPPSPHDSWWPRWVLDKKRGIEVLAPSVKGKPPSWMHAAAVAIGYRGQKKRYLFVRSATFEMDCRKTEVRQCGGAKTAEGYLQDLLSRGDEPSRHPGWTDGEDIEDDDKKKGKDKMVLTPGVAPRGKQGELLVPEAMQFASGPGGGLLNELEGDFERMALLHRSPNIRIKSSDHPDPLSEPRAAASIKLPELTSQDIVCLPAESAEKRLSSLQLETVCYAARRFRMSLPDGRTAGYILGDGTGCGKGRVISALLFHMWNSGARRSVWVSATNDLYHDACRDLADLGADIPCCPMRRFPPSGPLDKKGTAAHQELVRNLGIEGDGVIFCTYSLLVQTGNRRKLFTATMTSEKDRLTLVGEGGLLDAKTNKIARAHEGFGRTKDNSGADLQPGDKFVGTQSRTHLQHVLLPFTLSFERVLHDGKGACRKDAGDKVEKMSNDADNSEDLNPWNSRLGQIIAWLGGDEAGGLICFDEVHKAKNLVPDKADTASTKTGLYVDLLQKHCPKAPVLYVSATAATEVKHLGYMSRLGLWGPGTAFEDFPDFCKTMESGGVGAMEMLSINTKAIGASSCKAVAYVGTEFTTQQCGLTQEQRDSYDAACGFWAKLIRVYRKFIETKETKEIYRKKYFATKAEADTQRMWQFVWGSQQRFFKAMCNSAKVPATVAAAREALALGQQVVISIWATGEARTVRKMSKLKEDTHGRVLIDDVTEAGATSVTVKDKKTIESVILILNTSMRMRSDAVLGGKKLPRETRLLEAHGRRIYKPEDLAGVVLPAPLLFRVPGTRKLIVAATLSATKEKVKFELADDALGDTVIVSKVTEGPSSFRRAQMESWHVKTIAGRPVGKLNIAQIALRLRKGLPLAFQDAVIPDHLSGPQMILEHFINTFMLTHNGDTPVEWAVELKAELLEEMKLLKLPPNAMDEVLDSLGGLKHVAELSGRSHRMKRRKDGTFAYVARSEELRCTLDGANLVEQVLFQKGTKKVCMITEVASAGISLHSDRRQVRKGFQPPRRVMISLELPWGADKAIQVFGRVHRANQLVPPRFITLVTPLGGEVRFISAIARRMKLLGAVTKGDRQAAMGGVADMHMAEFDVNNPYGEKALEIFYRDTQKKGESERSDFIDLYESLPFIGTDGEASGKWPTWEDFRQSAKAMWPRLNMSEDLEQLCERLSEERATYGASGNGIRECQEMNRWFNRILMLEIDHQNAFFDTFFCRLLRADSGRPGEWRLR